MAWLQGNQGVRPPWWVSHLVLADRWGMKPWEMGDAPLVWVIRANEYYYWREKLRNH
jgi:hypothetical protein